MKINLKVLQKLAPIFGVEAIQSKPDVQKVIDSGNTDKAPAKYEPILTGAGYIWDDEDNAYSLESQTIYFIAPANVFIWTWGGLFRGLKGSEMLIKWIQGNEKYPEGKANQFMGTYKHMTGQTGAEQGGVAVAEPEQDAPESNADMERGMGGGDVTFSGSGKRADDFEPKSVDPTDALIVKLKKQAGFGKKLPADLMIDLGRKAKEGNNVKLLAFLKTIQPIMENSIKRSQLNALVREIVKGVIKEGWGDNEDNQVLDLADKAWGQNNWKVTKSRTTEHGTVYQVSFSHPVSRFLWKTPDGSWKALDPKTKKWNPVQADVGEMTVTGAVSPVMTPNAFKKKGPMEQSVTGAVAGFSTPNAFKKTKGMKEGLEPLGGMEEEKEEKIDEMTTTGDVSGYNIPAAFSKRGGSERGVKGSESLGYTLTPAGKKEMNRPADKLVEKKEKIDEASGLGRDFDRAQRAYDAQSPPEDAPGVECDKCGEEADVVDQGRRGGYWWWKAKCSHCGHNMSGDNF